jgi:Histidine phosphatase superfamily (branch 1)
VDHPPGEGPLTPGPDQAAPDAAAPDAEAPAAAAPEGLIPDGLDATLVLVRHGESTFIVEGRFQGQAETELSPDGVEQARRVAARLARPSAPPPLPVPAAPPLEIVH